MGKSLKGKKLPAGISQRPNGSYIGRVTYNGKTHTLYNRSLSDLKKELNELRYSLEHGTYIATSKMTFKDFYKEWLENYKQSSVKGSTLKQYKVQEVYFKSIDDMKIADIRATHLQKIFDNMEKNGYAQSTINVIFSIATDLFGYAYKIELIPRNPCDHVFLPRHGRTREYGTALTKEQQETFLKYCSCCKNSFIGDMCRLDLQTGLRGGELSALRWCDIDFKNKVIHVNHTMAPDGSLNTPKTRTSLRTVPMTDTAYEILKCKHEAYMAFKGNVISLSEDGFVFNIFGDPIDNRKREYAFSKLVKKVQNSEKDFPERFTMHGLRHTFATRCSEAGMDMNTLKTILGHSSLSMTADLYSHVQEDMKKQEMEKIQIAL